MAYSDQDFDRRRKEQTARSNRYNMDERGFTDIAPMQDDELNLQLRSEQRVAARNQRIAEQAGRANMEGLRNMQSYRVGGGASMMSNYYANSANLIMGQRTEAPDLLSGYRERAARAAQDRQDRRADRSMVAAAMSPPLSQGQPPLQPDADPAASKEQGGGGPVAPADDYASGGGSVSSPGGPTGPAGNVQGATMQGGQPGVGGQVPAGSVGAGAPGAAQGTMSQGLGALPAGGGVGGGGAIGGGTGGGAGAGAVGGPVGAIVGALASEALGGGGPVAPADQFSNAAQAGALAGQSPDPAAEAADVADQTYVRRHPFLDFQDDAIDEQMMALRDLERSNASMIGVDTVWPENQQMAYPGGGN